jgi:chaperonin cofactor prefoldin
MGMVYHELTMDYFHELTTSCSNIEKKLTTLNEEMESIKTQLLNMSAKPKRSNETNSEFRFCLR